MRCWGWPAVCRHRRLVHAPKRRHRCVLAGAATCSAANGLQGQCDALCNCVSSNSMYASDPNTARNTCKSQCEACVAATANCPSDDSLPGACAQNRDNAAVKVRQGRGARASWSRMGMQSRTQAMRVHALPGLRAWFAVVSTDAANPCRRCALFHFIVVPRHLMLALQRQATDKTARLMQEQWLLARSGRR